MATISGGIGDVRWSVLDEQLFQQQNGPFWWLMDGRSITGTSLAALKPEWGGTLPDERGEFNRNADAGRGLDSQSQSVAINIGTGVFTLPGAPTAPMYTLSTGQTVVLSTTGALPTGVTAGTKYYVIPVTGSTYRVASTPANAIAGTPVALSGIQSGTHTAVVSRVSGSHQGEDFSNHTHGVNDPGHSHGGVVRSAGVAAGGNQVGGNLDLNGSTAAAGTGVSVQSTSGAGGGFETRPRNNAKYCYVRVN